MKLLIATDNLHKLLELKAILKIHFPSLDVYTLRDFKDFRFAEEGLDSFEDNANAKALQAATFSKMLTLADDSGLVVPSLNGAPGVISACYAGKGALDRENNEKLLEDMKDFSENKRFAHYHCTLSLALPDKLIKTVTAVCEGRILESPRGAGGFGYDSLFIKHDYNHTFAEMPEDIKLKISHRRKAFDKLKITLEAQLLCTT
jgi:XTP/dITP diphosphohydrolase